MINRKSLLALGAANIVIIVVLQVVGRALLPGNILAFEFAGTAANASAMVEQWRNQNALGSLGFHLGFDYLFLIAYSLFLFVACTLTAERLTGVARSILLAIAWLQPIAGVLDATENLSLFQLMNGSQSDSWAALSLYCAVPKFGIALLGLISWLFGQVYATLSRK